MTRRKEEKRVFRKSNLQTAGRGEKENIPTTFLKEGGKATLKPMQRPGLSNREGKRESYQASQIFSPPEIKKGGGRDLAKTEKEEN